MNQSQTQHQNYFQQVIAILKNPWSVLVGVILGVILGQLFPTFAEVLKPLSDLYLNLLNMCVLPILVSGITLSVSYLLSNRDTADYVIRVIAIFLMAFLVMTSIAILVGIFMQPGSNLQGDTLRDLGIKISQADEFDFKIPLRGEIEEEETKPVVVEFLFKLIPNNIFKSLSEGNMLQVVFVTIIFGIALGQLYRTIDSTQQVIQILESIYESFKKIIDWILVLLPLALLSLVANKMKELGIEVLGAMITFLITTTIIFLILYLIGTLVIWWNSNKSIKEVINIIKEPTIVAMATTSTIASIPVAIEAMTDKLNFQPNLANAIIPLGITVGRFGQMSYFVIATIFAVNLYPQVELMNFSVITMILIGSIFAGIASSGATGVAVIYTLEVVFSPLGIPLGAVLVLFIAVDALVDPLRTVSTVHSSMAITAIIAKDSSQSIPRENLESL